MNAPPFVHWKVTLTIAAIHAASAGLFGVSSGQEGSLTPERFRQLHSELQPGPEDVWRTIPWKTSVLDGQRLAAQEGKPIFIWAMDGHPLGCT